MSRRLRIPDGLAFAELALERERGSGKILFASPPLARICLANGLDPEATLGVERRARWLIAGWYVLHLEFGGRPDYVAERILHEVAANPYVVANEVPFARHDSQ